MVENFENIGLNKKKIRTPLRRKFKKKYENYIYKYVFTYFLYILFILRQSFFIIKGLFQLLYLKYRFSVMIPIFLYFFYTLYYFSILLFVCVFFLSLFQKNEIGLLRKIEFLSYIIDRILLTE